MNSGYKSHKEFDKLDVIDHWLDKGFIVYFWKQGNELYYDLIRNDNGNAKEDATEEVQQEKEKD